MGHYDDSAHEHKPNRHSSGGIISRVTQSQQVNRSKSYDVHLRLVVSSLRQAKRPAFSSAESRVLYPAHAISCGNLGVPDGEKATAVWTSRTCIPVGSLARLWSVEHAEIPV